MLNTCQGLPILILIFGAVADRAYADAIVVTKAMKASTIAEIFVQQNSIHVELEIGSTDLKVFDDILSDEIYAKLRNTARSHPQRLERFFHEKLVLRADGGQPLPGRMEKLVARRRLARDEITGEPLPVQPKDAELVLHVVFEYTFDNKPTSLTIQPPLLADSSLCAANIGFVCYHNGLPINDFRYMPGEVSLDLDWDDPWYSRFRNPNLRRQFESPLSAYLYIEPYEVRKEIIVRPKDLQAWLDLGLKDDNVIPAEQQEELKQRVADFLSKRNPVTIDGQPATGRLDRIHFIRRTLLTTGIIEPAVDLDATSATLGIIFVYPVDSLPEKVSMQWELFTPKIKSIPTVASDEAGGIPSKVTPDDSVLVWKNYLTNPTSPKMLIVARPPAKRQFVLPMLSILCGSIAIGSLVVLVKRRASGVNVSRPTVAAALTALVVGVTSLSVARVKIPDPFSEPPQLSEQASKEILSSLLYNVYRSFDHHDESLIYDRLARSISGDLLSEVYLETRKSMEVKNQGGLRISVKEVNVTELDAVDSNEVESTFQCQWQVSGWIGHWGHIHARMNEHMALITLAERDGVWKISDMEMLDEQSVEPSQTPLPGQQAAGP